MFKVGTLDEIHLELLADFANRFPGHDTSRFKDNWKRLRTLAMAVLQLHAHVDDVYRQLMPDTADDANLERHGAIRAVPRKGATGAAGVDALRLVGAAASTFVSGTELVHADGTRFELDEDGTIPSEGFLDVDVVATDTGKVTNKQAGQVLTFVNPPTGIESSAELQVDLEGGTDREDPGSYRARILDKIRAPGMGGNAHDYEVWALQVPGIADAYVYPLRQGLGSVDVAALHVGSGETRLLTVGEIADLLAYLSTVRPVSVADLRVLTVESEPAAVEIAITPQSLEWAFDWDDTLPLAVTSYTAATRVLKFSTSRPLDIDVDHRLSYQGALNAGEELVVEALGPGTDEVTVRALTTDQAAHPPAAGNPVYAGGPLVKPLRDAILAMIDELGPGRGANADGAWNDTLSISILYGVVYETLAALGTRARRTQVVAPAIDVAGSNSEASSTIGLVTAQQVIVRRGG